MGVCQPQKLVMQVGVDIENTSVFPFPVYLIYDIFLHLTEEEKMILKCSNFFLKFNEVFCCFL